MTRDELLREFPLVDYCRKMGMQLIPEGKEFKALCPMHKEKTPSFTITPPDLWHCFGCNQGGSVIDLHMRVHNLGAKEAMRDLSEKVSAPKQQAPRPTGARRIVKTYDYTDERGEVVYQVVRYEPKDFRQRRPDGEGGWEANMDGVMRVLYRLPAVLMASEVFVCYHPDTEWLTPYGWQKAGIKPESVVQCNPWSGEMSFVQPNRWVENQFNGEMVTIGSRGFNVSTTPEHRFAVKSANWCKAKIRPAEQLRRCLWYPRSGKIIGGTPDVLTEAQVRLLVAFQADGMWTNTHRIKLGSNPFCWQHPAFNLKKQRKKIRIRELLDGCKLQWSEGVYKSCEAWTMFTLRREQTGWLGEWLDDDGFQWRMLTLPLSLRKAMLEELGYWDGDFSSERQVRFFTSSEQSANVAQAVASITGWSSHLRSKTREYRPNCKTEFVLNLMRDTEWRQCSKSPKRVAYSGPVYCCQVPSGFLLCRYKGSVFIAGNCEGEKDSDTLSAAGFVATTNVGGAGKWLTAYSECLLNKDVVIFPDNDEPGRKHADTVSQALADKANSIRVVKVPDGHKDVSDWLATVKEPAKAVRELVDKAPHLLKPLPIYTVEGEMAKHYAEQVRSNGVLHFDLAKFAPSFRGRVRPLVPGDLVVIMADTGHGKTVILTNMAKAARPLPTLLFELELPVEPMFERLAAMETGMSMRDIETAYKDYGELPVDKSLSKLSHILVCPESGLTTDQIERLIYRSELKGGAKPAVVIVDYIGLVGASTATRSRYESASVVAEQMKVIAKRTGTIVIAGAQIARPDRGAKSVEVGLHAAKDSGSIENSCSLLIGAWRPEQHRDQIMLKILKNSRGVTGATIKCNFDGGKNLITEMNEGTEYVRQ